MSFYVSSIRENTVKFDVTFYEWDGQTPVDPDGDVKFILYDERYQKLTEVLLGEANHPGVGKYEFFYTFDTAGKYVAEFRADFCGLTSLDRGNVIVTN